jgi:hypothetical protein
MTEMEIVIAPAGGRRQADVFTAYWGDILLATSRTPFFDSARKLLTASGTTVTTAGADATIIFGAGNNESIKALGGGSTLNFMGAGTGEVVHLSNSGDNTVNVGSGGGSITIDGLAATDALFFADTQANATVTQVSKTEVTIAFADTGQSIDLHFANHAAEVAIVGSLHYGA